MWGDYMSDDLVDNFEKEYGVKVNLSYMNDNASSITKRPPAPATAMT